MHPCLSEAMALLNDVLKDAGNVAKVQNRVARAMAEIDRFANQRSEPEAATPPAPENTQGPAPEKKAPAKKK